MRPCAGMVTAGPGSRRQRAEPRAGYQPALRRPLHSSRELLAVGSYNGRGRARRGPALERQELVTGSYPDPAGNSARRLQRALRRGVHLTRQLLGRRGDGVISFDSEVTENQALHWNGKTWSLANIPDPAVPRRTVSAPSAASAAPRPGTAGPSAVTEASPREAPVQRGAALERP